MKSLTKKIVQTLTFALLALPTIGHASMRVYNNTQHVVKFAIYQGSEGNTLQSIVVPANTQRTLSLARQYKIVVVVDGVTLDPVVTANPNTNFRVISTVDRDGNEGFEVQF
ncbi:hypothetical protein [Bdellovibrio sp. BCCA]|uniref:hypothetical protein n=1 Tax=Bdellovibrio sp. BCCA TaxID=3136281 RepID=UPI0030F228DF